MARAPGVSTLRRIFNRQGTCLPPPNPQTFRNQNAIEQIEEPLHEQREHGSGNCALQNCDVIVQVESAQDRFAQTAGANQCRQGGCADIDYRAGFNSGQDRTRGDR